MDLHSPEAEDLNEFSKHQENIVPITAAYIGKRNLDVGCGNGLTSLALQETLGIKPTLCDIIDMRNALAKKLPFYKIGDGKLPFNDKSFDSSYLQYVLHHVDNEEKVKKLLAECCRVANTVIIVEEIAGAKTDIVKAKFFDEKVNRIIHPEYKMNVFKYYSQQELTDTLEEMAIHIIRHEIISYGSEENGFLETHVFLASAGCSEHS